MYHVKRTKRQTQRKPTKKVSALSPKDVNIIWADTFNALETAVSKLENAKSDEKPYLRAQIAAIQNIWRYVPTRYISTVMPKGVENVARHISMCTDIKSDRKNFLEQRKRDFQQVKLANPKNTKKLQTKLLDKPKTSTPKRPYIGEDFALYDALAAEWARGFVGRVLGIAIVKSADSTDKQIVPGWYHPKKEWLRQIRHRKTFVPNAVAYIVKKKNKPIEPIVETREIFIACVRNTCTIKTKVDASLYTAAKIVWDSEVSERDGILDILKHAPAEDFRQAIASIISGLLDDEQTYNVFMEDVSDEDFLLVARPGSYHTKMAVYKDILYEEKRATTRHVGVLKHLPRQCKCGKQARMTTTLPASGVQVHACGAACMPDADMDDADAYDTDTEFDKFNAAIEALSKKRDNKRVAKKRDNKRVARQPAVPSAVQRIRVQDAKLEKLSLKELRAKAHELNIIWYESLSKNGLIQAILSHTTADKKPTADKPAADKPTTPVFSVTDILDQMTETDRKYKAPSPSKVCYTKIH